MVRRQAETAPPAEGGATAYGHDAFISYSRVDAAAAAHLKHAMERFATPWYRARGARVFLDTASLAGGPSLRTAVEAALQDSAAFVLLASTASRSSDWVRVEVDWWLAHRGVDDLLVAVLDSPAPGPAADPPASVWAGAVPPEWRSAFPDEPLWIDLRWLAQADKVDPDDPRLVDAAAQVLASVRHQPKDQLVGAHLSRRRQLRRVVTAVIGALVLLLALALTAAGLAVDQRNTAITERYAATSRQLVAQSRSIEDERPSLARQLLLQAYRLAATEEAVGAVIASPRLSHEVRVAGQAPTVTVNPVQPLTAVVAEGRLTLYATDSGRRLTALATGVPEEAPAAFSAAGDALAAVTAPGRVTLYDVSNTAAVRTTGRLRIPRRAERIAYAPTGRMLVVASPSALSFHDLTDPGSPVRLATVANPADDAGALVLLEDGTLLAPGATTVAGRSVGSLPAPVLITPLASPGAVVSADRLMLARPGDVGDVELWDIGVPGRPRLRAALPGESFAVGDLAFSGDGRALAVGTLSGVTQLWDLTDVTRPILGERLRGVPASVPQVAFGSASSRLVVVSDDPTYAGPEGATILRSWPVRGAGRAGSTSRIDGGRQAVPAWSPDGRTIAGGFPARLWDLADPRFPRPGGALPTLAIGGGAVFAYRPGSDLVASGVPVVLWDASDPDAPRRLGTDPVLEPATLATFRPDGGVLATGAAFGPVSLWSVSDGRGERLAELRGSSAQAHGAVFVADGSRLVVLDADEGATVWDVRTPDAARPVGRLLTAGEPISALAADERTATVLAGGARGRLSVWDVSDPASPRQVASRQAHQARVTGLALSPDGRLLATAGEDALRLWARDPGGGALRPMATLAVGGVYDGAAVSFSPDGSLLAAATNDGLQVWDVDVPRLLGHLCAESEPITAAQWREYLPSDLAYDPPCLVR